MAGTEHGRSVALLLESDGPGGAEQMLIHLAEGLRDRGWNVCPVGPVKGEGWLGDELRARGFVPETFSLRSPVDWRCARDLARTLERRGVRVVHGHEFTMAVYGAAAASLIGARSVVTMHGGKRALAALRRRLALRWAFRRSAGVVAVSSAVRLDLMTALGRAAAGVRVIPNGIPLRRGDGARIRRELGIPDGALVIVSVGNLYPVKGHDFLFEALRLVGEELPDLDWRLVVAGKATEEGRPEDEAVALPARAAAAGLGERLHLLGFRSDVPDLLAAADVFAMPSLSEGLPLALLEAMFAGAAVVASEVGGIPEAIDDGVEGLLSPPADARALAAALVRLGREPELRRALGERARLRALRDFSADRMVDAYEQLYGADGGLAGAAPVKAGTSAALDVAP